MNILRKSINQNKRELATLLGIFLIYIFFTIMDHSYLSWANFLLILQQSTINGIIAVGMTYAIMTGGIDLSVGAVYGIVIVAIAKMTVGGMNPVLALIVGLIFGPLTGCVTGILVTKLKLQPFIATLGTMEIFRGIAYLTTDGRYIRIKDDAYYFIGKGKLAGIPFCLIIMLITYVVIWFVLKYTVYGRSVFAVGGNMQVARLAGINVKKIRFISHILAGITAVMGGVITVCQASSCMASHGYGNDMNVISAVILGGISMAGGRGNVFGTLIGVASLSTLVNGMTLLNVNSYWQQIIQGLVLVFAVFIDAVLSSKRGN